MTDTNQWRNKAGIGVSPSWGPSGESGLIGCSLDREKMFRLYCLLQNFEYGRTPSFAISCFTTFVPRVKYKHDYLGGEVLYLWR